jgi:hypothetical protein
VHEGKVRSWPEENLIDGRLITHWCTADQTREWIHISLVKNFSLSRIGIVNGSGGKNERFRFDARVKDIRIELSNGWKKDFRLEDHGKIQYFDLEEQKTDYIKLTIRSLYPTTLWSHVCVGEIEVYAQI